MNKVYIRKIEPNAYIWDYVNNSVFNLTYYSVRQSLNEYMFVENSIQNVLQEELQ